MYKVLLASAAAVLVTGSLANAQFLLGQNDRGHKEVRNLWAERSIAGERGAARRFAAPIPQSRSHSSTTTARGFSPGFLIEGGQHKRVTNQYSGYSWPR